MHGAISLINLVIVLSALLGIALFVRVVIAMRQGLAWFSRALSFAVWVYFGATMILALFGLWFAPNLKPHVSVVAGLAAVIALSYKMHRRRSRHIPLGIKRKVIARDLNGQPYDPQQHHIDHIWPHSRWGSNTSDNLRVIERSRNLRKGAKLPKLRDWL